jgi:hypothetical protein
MYKKLLRADLFIKKSVSHIFFIYPPKNNSIDDLKIRVVHTYRTIVHSSNSVTSRSQNPTFPPPPNVAVMASDTHPKFSISHALGKPSAAPIPVDDE